MRFTAPIANAVWEKALIKRSGPSPPLGLVAGPRADAGDTTLSPHQALVRYPPLERWRISSCVRVIKAADRIVAVFEEKTPLAPSEGDRRTGDGRLGRALHFSTVTSGAPPTDRRLWLFPRAWSFLEDAELAGLFERAVQVRSD